MTWCSLFYFIFVEVLILLLNQKFQQLSPQGRDRLKACKGGYICNKQAVLQGGIILKK